MDDQKKRAIFKIYDLPPDAEGFDVDLIKRHNEIKRKILEGNEDQLTSKDLDFMIENSLPNFYVEFEEIKYLLPVIFNFLKTQGRHSILTDDFLLQRVIQYKDVWTAEEKTLISELIEWYTESSFNDGDSLDACEIILIINHWFPDFAARMDRLFQSHEDNKKYTLIQIFDSFIASKESIKQFFVNYLFQDTPYFTISDAAEKALQQYFNRDYIQRFVLSNLYVLEERWESNLIEQLKEKIARV